MSTALATQNPPPPSQPLVRREPPRSIVDLIQTDRVREQVRMAIPTFLTADRMLRIAVTSINRSQDLQKCTPESLLSSLMVASAMGIEPDGRHGHLIARFNSRLGKHECTFQADYKGLVALVRRSGDVTDIYADLVRDADDFRVTKGLHRDLIHNIDIRKPRGEVLGAYAVIQYKEGPPGFDFMACDEIDAIRERSDGWRAFKAGKISSTPWHTDYGEMAKKTVLKRLLKLADLSGETAERVALDVDTTVTPSVTVGAPEIPRPHFDALPAGTPANGDMPAPPADSPRRRTRQAKAIEVPATAATPPVVDEAPLPGAEPEPGPHPPAEEPAHAPEHPHPADVTPSSPVPSPGPKSKLADLRAQHPDATDAQILKALVRWNLAEPATVKLSDVPETKLVRAWEDPVSIGEEVALIIEAGQ